MGFTNRIRLPFELKQPQFPEDKTVYRYANGVTKTLSVVVRETYAGETDYMSAKWHRRLTIALAHDNVTVEGDQLLSGVSKDGDYEINWPSFKGYPTAKAAFLVNVTPFDNTNSNCMTCEQASQLNLHDDTFPDELEENTTYTLDAADNDAICCYPATFSITSFNSTYLSSATIDQDGIITINTKSGYPSAAGIKLLTYRVTCPNGGFDEADVFGSLEGDEPGCLAPSNIQFTNITASAADVSFDPPAMLPDHYLWRLYKVSAPGVLVQTGTSTTTFHLSGLDASVEYIVYVRSQCGPLNDDETASNFISNTFITANNTSLCGEYSIFFSSSGDRPRPFVIVGYLDCNGEHQSVSVPNNTFRKVCMSQVSPGVPTSVTIPSGFTSDVTINYNGLC